MNPTHLNQMEFPTVINLTSPFQFKGLVGRVFFIFSQILIEQCKQTVVTLIKPRIMWHGICMAFLIYHFKPNGIAHSYQLDQSITV